MSYLIALAAEVTTTTTASEHTTDEVKNLAWIINHLKIRNLSLDYKRIWTINGLPGNIYNCLPDVI